MHIEVDQSVKVEDLGDTILAFSDGVEFAILIPDAAKKAAKRELSGRGISGPKRTLRMFAAALFLLLRNHLDDITLVTIDDEYGGRGKEIIRLLLRLVWRVKPSFPEDCFEIREITKKSPAHRKAWETKQKTIKPNKIIKVKDFLEAL